MMTRNFKYSEDNQEKKEYKHGRRRVVGFEINEKKSVIISAIISKSLVYFSCKRYKR